MCYEKFKNWKNILDYILFLIEKSSYREEFFSSSIRIDRNHEFSLEIGSM